ncbi:MAG TPA: hypothetical protein VKD28_12840 [Gemmatimonadales bacterium]|nr:hypothetical protein [Gemmatimonadales bacterium]
MKKKDPPPPDPDQQDLFDQPPTLEPRGWEGTRIALDRLETYKPEMVAKLRRAAHEHFETTMEPVSVNDIRHVLDDEHYEGDGRILGVVFLKSEWTKVGESMTNAPRTNAGKTRSIIGLYVPKEYAATNGHHR